MKVTGEQYIPVMLFNCVIVQDGSTCKHALCEHKLRN